MQLSKRKCRSRRGSKGRKKEKQKKGRETLNACLFFGKNLNFRHLGRPFQAMRGGEEWKVGGRGSREGRGKFRPEFGRERRSL